jgi:hypothetical protein
LEGKKDHSYVESIPEDSPEEWVTVKELVGLPVEAPVVEET